MDNKSLKQIIESRLDKIKKLKDNGVAIYPEKFIVSHSIDQLKNKDTTSNPIKLAGRIISIRSMGNATFVNINDFTGQQQIFFKKNNLPEHQYQNLIKLLDIGDIIGIQGILFFTKTKELTLNAQERRG